MHHRYRNPSSAALNSVSSRSHLQAASCSRRHHLIVPRTHSVLCLHHRKSARALECEWSCVCVCVYVDECEACAHLAAGLRCAASIHRVLAGERPCPPQDPLISFCPSCEDAGRTAPKSQGWWGVVVCWGGVLSEHVGLWISHARAQSEEGLCGRRVVGAGGGVVNTQQPTF